MKRISILFILAFIPFFTNAQIVIDSSNFPVSKNETDSLIGMSVGFSPKPGANMNWGYGPGKFNNVQSFLMSNTYSSSTNNKFKTATRSTVQTITPHPPIGGLAISDTEKGTFYLTDNANGYAYTGYSVTKRQVFGDGEGDSLIYMVFDTSIAANPQYILKYPAAYDSTWSYSSRLTCPLQFYVSPVGIYGYYSGLEIIHRTVIDSVVGWGNMVIPYKSYYDSATTAIPVIMVKETWVDNDSFWASLPSYSSININDIMNNFNIQQQNEVYSYTFYRVGYSAPLIKFWYGSSDFNRTPYIAGFDPSNTTIQMGIEDISEPVVAGIYPNPVTSSGFTITFARQDNAPKNLTITNSLGQVVQRLPLLQNQTTATINVPPGLANGMYYYTITETGGGGMVSGKFVLAR